MWLALLTLLLLAAVATVRVGESSRGLARGDAHLVAVEGLTKGEASPCASQGSDGCGGGNG